MATCTPTALQLTPCSCLVACVGVGCVGSLHTSVADAVAGWCLPAGSLGSLVLKLGPKYDMGALCPDANEGWDKAAKGKDWCVWIKKHE